MTLAINGPAQASRWKWLATIGALLMTWACTVACGVVPILFADLLLTGRVDLKKLWIMILPAVIYASSAIAALYFPLVIWVVQRARDTRRLFFEGALLFVSLIAYFLARTVAVVELNYEDVGAIWMLVVPAVLSILALMYIGRVHRASLP